jgi:hypothetical protein
MAGLATHDKRASDEQYRALFPLIEAEAGAFDDRNFVPRCRR